jgi:hypothetical protein
MCRLLLGVAVVSFCFGAAVSGMALANEPGMGVEQAAEKKMVVPVKKTVEAVYLEKVELKGKQVQVQGKVVKVNKNVLKRNFIHLEDGTGKKDNGTNAILATSQDMVVVGDEVVGTGTLGLDVDFGIGYANEVVLEEASISKVER